MKWGRRVRDLRGVPILEAPIPVAVSLLRLLRRQGIAAQVDAWLLPRRRGWFPGASYPSRMRLSVPAHQLEQARAVVEKAMQGSPERAEFWFGKLVMQLATVCLVAIAVTACFRLLPGRWAERSYAIGFLTLLGGFLALSPIQQWLIDRHYRRIAQRGESPMLEHPERERGERSE